VYSGSIRRREVMSKRIKIVAQIIDIETNTILEESPLFNKVAERPKDLDQLGFTHQEQISIHKLKF